MSFGIWQFIIVFVVALVGTVAVTWFRDCGFGLTYVGPDFTSWPRAIKWYWKTRGDRRT